MAAEQAAAAGQAAVLPGLTPDELNMKTYLHALVVPRAWMADDDTPFGFVISPTPAAQGRVVVIGTGTPFANKMGADGQVPAGAALVRNQISVVHRTYCALQQGALVAEGAGLVLSSGRVHVLSVADGGATIVVRKEAGGAEFVLHGGMATLLRMVDRSWLLALLRQARGTAAAGQPGPSGGQRRLNGQTLDMTAEADNGVWAIVAEFVQAEMPPGTAAAAARAAAPLWVVAHVMAAVSPAMAAAAAALVDQKETLQETDVRAAQSAWRSVAEMSWRTTEARRAAVMAAPDLQPGESPRRSARAAALVFGRLFICAL